MSESAAGVRAAVRAGVAAALLDREHPADGLVPLTSLRGRHVSHLVLRSSPAATGAACDAVRDAIRIAFGHSGRST